MTPITDMTRGVYRRIYAGFILGRRINSVSLEAEAWFWRMHAIADDFGNLPADPVDIRILTQGRRSVSDQQVQAWVSECIAVGLMQQYEVEEQQFLHIDGFEELQIGPRNGRRLQKVPVHPGASRCKSVNHDEKWASHTHSHTHQQHQEGPPAAAGGGESGGATTRQQPVALTPEQAREAAILRKQPWLIRARKAEEVASSYPAAVIEAGKRIATGRGVRNPGGMLLTVLESGEAAEESRGREGSEDRTRRREDARTWLMRNFAEGCTLRDEFASLHPGDCDHSGNPLDGPFHDWVWQRLMERRGAAR